MRFKSLYITASATKNIILELLQKYCNSLSKMRFIIFLAICSAAVFAAPLYDDDDKIFDQLAQLDQEDDFATVELNDEEGHFVAKRTIDDATLEQLLLAKMEFIFKIMGPLAPAKVKEAIRKIVNERKSEIIQVVKAGGGALIKLLIEIWKNAFLGGLFG